MKTGKGVNHKTKTKGLKRLKMLHRAEQDCRVG